MNRRRGITVMDSAPGVAAMLLLLSMSNKAGNRFLLNSGKEVIKYNLNNNQIISC